MVFQPFNFTWIQQGVMLAASLPTSEQDIRSVHSLGIRAIVSLTRRSIFDTGITRELLSSLDMRIVQEVIADGEVPTPEQKDRILSFMDECRGQNRPIMVHCRGGYGRTGIILWLYYTHHGMTSRDAVKMIWHARHECGPQTDAQRAMTGAWCGPDGIVYP